MQDANARSRPTRREGRWLDAWPVLCMVWPDLWRKLHSPTSPIRVGTCVAVESQALASTGSCRSKGARRLGASQCTAPIAPCAPAGTNRALRIWVLEAAGQVPESHTSAFPMRRRDVLVTTSCPCSRTLQMVDDGESGKGGFRAGDLLGHHVRTCVAAAGWQVETWEGCPQALCSGPAGMGEVGGLTCLGIQLRSAVSSQNSSNRWKRPMAGTWCMWMAFTWHGSHRPFGGRLGRQTKSGSIVDDVAWSTRHASELGEACNSERSGG